MDAFVKFENVSKIYQTGYVKVYALRNVSFEIEEGEICVIVGQSGAGKTTLLILFRQRGCSRMYDRISAGNQILSHCYMRSL